MALRIAICGSHPATKYRAPFADDTWQIWACSPHNFSRGQLPRVDEWFELHVPAGDPTRPADYLAFLGDLSQRVPVWMRDRRGHPAARTFPEDELRARFGPFFFTSSIAWMLAKAIAAKPEAIGLWGIMQATANEFTYQRPGIQHFIQRAHDDGIAVVVPVESRLFEPQEVKW